VNPAKTLLTPAPITITKIHTMLPKSDNARTRLGKNSGSPLTTSPNEKREETRAGTRNTKNPVEKPLRSPKSVGSLTENASAVPSRSSTNSETSIQLVEGKATRRIAL